MQWRGRQPWFCGSLPNKVDNYPLYFFVWDSVYTVSTKWINIVKGRKRVPVFIKEKIYSGFLTVPTQIAEPAIKFNKLPKYAVINYAGIKSHNASIKSFSTQRIF